MRGSIPWMAPEVVLGRCLKLSLFRDAGSRVPHEIAWILDTVILMWIAPGVFTFFYE